MSIPAEDNSHDSQNYSYDQFDREKLHNVSLSRNATIKHQLH